jgi:DNA-directed RNA polymerase subunit RPC12/RpoP
MEKLDQMGEVVMWGSDLDGKPIMGSVRYPTYTCGHCSKVVVMRADRTRERVRCKTCGRLLCESNELCKMECTPIHELARDRFEADEKWTRLVQPLMAGVQTEEEAIRRGLKTF